MDFLPAGKPLGFPAFQLGSSALEIAGVGMRGEHMRSSNARTQRNRLSREKSMKRKILRTITLGSFALVVFLGAAWQVQAQDAKIRIPAWPRWINI